MLFETLESIPGFVDGKLTNKFGNWANDADCAPFVGCSFMDLHDDVGYGASPEQPMFTIQPVYWDMSIDKRKCTSCDWNVSVLRVLRRYTREQHS